MSECIDDRRLIRLVAGELDAAEREALSAHLRGCEACQARYQGQRATWELLGEWHAEPPERDMAVAVQAAAARDAGRRRWGEAGRLAAAMALAAVAGTAAGLFTPIHPTVIPVGREVSAEEVADAIGLEVLGQTGSLTQLFVEDAPAIAPSAEGPS